MEKIIFHKETKTFHLYNEEISYIMCVLYALKKSFGLPQKCKKSSDDHIFLQGMRNLVCHEFFSII